MLIYSKCLNKDGKKRFILIKLCIVALLLISICVSAQDFKVDSNFHVYLLIGQSNMAGRGVLDEESNQQNDKILMLNKENEWVIAQDPVHFDKPAVVGVGPAISFAKAMMSDQKNIKIGLIPCAHGGSTISVWQPGKSYFKVNYPYDDALKRAKIAMQKGVLRGILWHQGESDNDSTKAAVYMERLKVLISNLRRDLQLPEVPFIAGEIGYFEKKVFINDIINKLPHEVSNTAVVSAKNLTHKGDNVHFDAVSARELGKRYALKMKHLLDVKKKNKNNIIK